MFGLIVRFRWIVLALAAAITVAFASQLPKLELEPDTEAYVPEDHPVRTYWNEAKDRFGLGREILVAVEATGRDGVYDPEVLAGIKRLTEVIEAVEGVASSDVRSLSNSEAMIGTAYGLEVEPFFDDPPTTREEAAVVRQRVFENPVFLDRLASRDGTIAAIFVKTEVEADRAPEVYARLMEAIDDVAISGARVLVAGNPAIEYVYGRQMTRDLQRLIPLALATVVLILYVCFPTPGPKTIVLRAALAAVVIAGASLASGRGAPSWSAIGLGAPVLAMLTAPGVLLPCAIVVMSVIWTWGAQAFFGLPIYIAGTLVPPLLLAIGSAQGIHIVGRFHEQAARSEVDKHGAIVATMNQIWRPIVLTSITTAVGFGSLALGQMTVYRVFGVTTAFGVLAAMAVALTVLPAMLSVLPLSASLPAGRARASGDRPGLLTRMLVGLSERLESRRVLVLASAALVTIGLLWSATKLQVDYSWVESLAPGTPVLEADRVLRKRHGGTMPLNVIVRTAKSDGIKEPEILRAIDTVLSEVARDPMVGDTRSIVEYVKRMSQAMNDDRADDYRVPESRDLVAQYLLVYSMSGDPGELDDVVDYDYQAANLSILLRTDRLSVLRDILADVERLLDEHVRSRGATATLTGSASILDVIFTMVLASQVRSLATTAAMVFLFLALLFRSLRDAAVCMLPLAITVIANFGLMAALDIPLGPDKAMIGAIALGIGIDYSIHLMSRFRDTLEEGMSVFQGIVEAVRTTGRAILFNGVVVVAGFLVIGSSETPSNATFGLIIAGNVALSCVTAMLVLPAALAVIGHREMMRAARAPVRIAGRTIAAHTARALGIEGE